MSESNIYDVVPVIFNDIAASDKIQVFVICGLFFIINKYIVASGKKNDQVAMMIEEMKNDILLEIKETKVCVVRIMYDMELKKDRRKNNINVNQERRKDD